jgi:hypothetical protein
MGGGENKNDILEGKNKDFLAGGFKKYLVQEFGQEDADRFENKAKKLTGEEAKAYTKELYGEYLEWKDKQPKSLKSQTSEIPEEPDWLKEYKKLEAEEVPRESQNDTDKDPRDSFQRLVDSLKTSEGKPLFDRPSSTADELKAHIFDGKEIGNPLLKSFYEDYLHEFYGVKGVENEHELYEIFKPKEKNLSGPQKASEIAEFRKYILDRFSDWLSGRMLAATGKESERKSAGMWDNPDTILKTKDIILNGKGELAEEVKPVFQSFLRKNLGVETVEQALGKISSPDLGENATKDILVSDFLNFLKDEGKEDVIGKMQTKEELPSKSEEPEPSKEEVHEKIFELSVNQDKLDKFADPAAKEGLTNFLKLLPQASTVSINVGKENGVPVLKTIGIEANIGGLEQKTYLSAILARTVIDNCEGFKSNKGKGTFVGLLFRLPDGTFQFIAPDSPQDSAKDILSRISFNGVRLPDKDKFNLVFNLPKK